MQPRHQNTRIWLHVVLFGATCITTVIAGYEQAGVPLLSNPGSRDLTSITGSETGAALLFSAALLAILMAHELGHYVAARRSRVEVSLPYLIPGIPIPVIGMLPFVGTFGAFMRMDGERLSSLQRLQVAAWGPITGLVVALPVLLIGIATSPVKVVTEGAVGLGPSLVILTAEWLFHPQIPPGSDVILTPVAMAGWFGCFFTALNLLPYGSLDGGHIAVAVFGDRWHLVERVVVVLVVALAVFQFTGWLVFLLVVRWLGTEESPTTLPRRSSDGSLSEMPTPTEGERGASVSLFHPLVVGSLVIFLGTVSLAPMQGMSLVDLVSRLLS